MGHLQNRAGPNVLMLLNPFSGVVVVADKDSHLPLDELSRAPPLFGQHSTTNVGETFHFSDGFLSKPPIIMNVRTVFATWVTPEKVELGGLAIRRWRCDALFTFPKTRGTQGYDSGEWRFSTSRTSNYPHGMCGHGFENGVDAKFQNLVVQVCQGEEEVFYGKCEDTIGLDGTNGLLDRGDGPLKNRRVLVHVEVFSDPLHSLPLTCEVAGFLFDEGKALVHILLREGREIVALFGSLFLMGNNCRKGVAATLPPSQLFKEPLPCFLEIVSVATMPIQHMGRAVAEGVHDRLCQLEIR